MPAGPRRRRRPWLRNFRPSDLWVSFGLGLAGAASLEHAQCDEVRCGLEPVPLRVSSRSLVLVDSDEAVERPWVRVPRSLAGGQRLGRRARRTRMSVCGVGPHRAFSQQGPDVPHEPTRTITTTRLHIPLRSASPKCKSRQQARHGRPENRRSHKCLQSFRETSIPARAARVPSQRADNHPSRSDYG